MSNKLDQKLREIIWKYQGDYAEPLEEFEIDKALAQIHKAFIDAGYFKVPPEYLLMPVREDMGYMTGQEWYERFEKEYVGTAANYADIEAYAAAKRAAGIDTSQTPEEYYADGNGV